MSLKLRVERVELNVSDIVTRRTIEQRLTRLSDDELIELHGLMSASRKGELSEESLNRMDEIWSQTYEPGNKIYGGNL